MYKLMKQCIALMHQEHFFKSHNIHHKTLSQTLREEGSRNRHINTLTHESIVLDDRQIYECVRLCVCLINSHQWPSAQLSQLWYTHWVWSHSVLCFRKLFLICCSASVIAKHAVFFLSFTELLVSGFQRYWSAATHLCPTIIIHYSPLITQDWATA